MPPRVRLPTTVFSELRRGFKEVPELMLCGVLGAIGWGYGALMFASYYNSKNEFIKPYKNRYTVIRPDDPRAKRVRCSPDLPRGDERILKVPASKDDMRADFVVPIARVLPASSNLKW